jgi:hypothetical protein
MDMATLFRSSLESMITRSMNDDLIAAMSRRDHSVIVHKIIDSTELRQSH